MRYAIAVKHKTIFDLLSVNFTSTDEDENEIEKNSNDTQKPDVRGED